MKVRGVRAALAFQTLLLLSAQSQNRDNVQDGGAAFLRVDPNRLQFFEYESFSLSCAGSDGSAGWRVMRTFSSGSPQWETSTGSVIFEPAFVSHSGEYFCQNEKGTRSKPVNVSVTDGDVILESPALPVVEGDAVTLSCRRKGENQDKLPADFYKDGSIIKTEYSGQTTIQHISRSDEGFYSCSISGANDDSAESWLAVTANIPPSPQETTSGGAAVTPADPGSKLLSVLPAVVSVVCVAVLLLLLLLVVGLLQCRRHRVACFSSEAPAADPPNPVYDQVGGTDAPTAVYSKVNKPKKRRGPEQNAADPNHVTYSTVTVQRKEGASRQKHESETNKSTYAVIVQKRGC